MKRPAHNSTPWTEDRIAFLKENHQRFTNAQLAQQLNLKVTVVRMKCYELGLYKMRLQYWTDEQICFLRTNYKEKGDTELAEIFNERWHKDKGWSKKHIEKKRRYLGLKRTVKERNAIREQHRKNGVYKEANKKMWKTRGARPIGTVVTWKGQSLTKTEKGYVHTRVVVWEKFNGKVPENMLVCHKDGNPLNCHIENLELLTRQENAIKNHSYNYSAENMEALVLLSEIRKKIKNLKRRNHGKKQNARPKGPSFCAAGKTE